ncbi:MAG: carboxypeptidase-like regulatory domain-containing protein [Planctomycetaceae bacterium]|nr:carboxypeptidase-like regulatory domain-containing protein [Planctomycetaceae bacterium]
MYRLIPVSVFCICLALCSGCGPKQTKTYYVEGTITIDGQPAEKVLVTFVPKTEGNGVQASGVTDAQGIYKLTSLRGKQDKGAAAGDYAVTVSKREWKPAAVPFVDPVTKQEFKEESFEIIPVQYRNPFRSPLNATVSAGENKGLDFDIVLK